MIKDVLLSSRYCIGPMSKNIVDAILDFSNKNKIPFTFIPSRRQIEYNGGYVNNWTTEEFSKYVKDRSKIVAIQRDHSGPGQGIEDDDGMKSLEEDCKFFDSIHIDPWKKYSEYDDGLKWTIEMLKYCYTLNPNMYFEIGTEEAIRYFSIEELERFLKDLKSALSADIYSRILFCVIQSGTRIKGTHNTGVFDLERLRSMLEVLKKYNMMSKEHNGDYLSEHDVRMRFQAGLGSINIAPEFGVFETDLFLNQIKEKDDMVVYNLLYKLSLESKKWCKWVDENFNPEKEKDQIIRITGHYLFSRPEFAMIKYDGIDDVIIRNIIDKLGKMVGYI